MGVQRSVGRRLDTRAAERGARSRADWGTQELSLATNPAAQVKPQLVPLQVAVPFAGCGQGVQDEPHVAGSEFAAQAPPQRWNPFAQETPQRVPSQVAMPFAGTGQGVQALPQEFVLVSLTQALPQRW